MSPPQGGIYSWERNRVAGLGFIVSVLLQTYHVMLVVPEQLRQPEISVENGSFDPKYHAGNRGRC